MAQHRDKRRDGSSLDRGAVVSLRAPARRMDPDWTRAAGWPLPWWLRGFVEQCAVAGPIFGVLSALYWFHLQQIAPLAPDPARQAVIREALTFHGRFRHAYYITPDQHLLWLGLTAPAVAWLVMVVAAAVGLGIRSHYRLRR